MRAVCEVLTLVALLGPHSGGTSRNPDLPPGQLDARDATVDTRPDPRLRAWVRRG